MTTDMKFKIVGTILFFCLLMPFFSEGQTPETQRVVRGTVTSATDGETLVGATVIEADDKKRIISATVKALEIIDECLGKIVEAVENNFYTLILLSDHGNADYMLDEMGNPVTTHSLSKVPFLIEDKNITLSNGSLADVAPTILSYMDIAIPQEMKNSKILIEKD